MVLLIVAGVVCAICLVWLIYGIAQIFYPKKEPEPMYHYWIGWEDKRGLRAYSSWLGKDPDDALYTFRCNHPGRRILIITWNLIAVQKRLDLYPWGIDKSLD